MIEVERKFEPCEIAVAEICEGSEDLGEKEVVDEYWDTREYQLTIHDFWLRRRDVEGWQLKCPVDWNSMDKTMTGMEKIDKYEEITDEKELILTVQRVLKLNPESERDGVSEALKIESFLKRFDMIPVCKIETRRKSFLKKFEDVYIRIDLDRCDFGYSVGEIELLVDSKGKVESASLLLERFVNEYSLSETRAESKVAVYLQRKSPKHYEILKNAGVL